MFSFRCILGASKQKQIILFQLISNFLYNDKIPAMQNATEWWKQIIKKLCQFKEILTNNTEPKTWLRCFLYYLTSKYVRPTLQLLRPVLGKLELKLV